MRKLILFTIILLSVTSYSQYKTGDIIGRATPIKVLNSELNISGDIKGVENDSNQFENRENQINSSEIELGVTSGELSVSLTGAANYNVPIAVPIGVNGDTPQISISYNSQSGNGIVGYGWNISGISKITRIPATKYHDDIIDGVDFDNLDRFALDGKRLVVKNGTSGVYGANNTEYETENFSNIKITSVGVSTYGANYGPNYFVVHFPDGSIAYYGNSTSNKTQDEWAIAYIINPVGLRTNYSYTKSNNTLYVSSITYGTKTTTGICRIDFTYKNRLRNEQGYVNNINFIRSLILDKIESSVKGQMYRRYNFGYNVSLNYERLSSITETNNENKQLRPTLFQYENTQREIVYDNNIELSVDDITNNNSSSITGDFDGDGLVDFILQPKLQSEKNKFWFFNNYYIGSTNYGIRFDLDFEYKSIFPINFLLQDDSVETKQGIVIIRTYSEVINGITQFYKKAIICSYEYGIFIYQYERDIAYEGGYGNQNFQEFIADFDGDGMTEYGYASKHFAVSSPTIAYTILDRRVVPNSNNSNTIFSTSSIPITNSFKLELGDFNGDGLDDLYLFDSGKVKICRRQINGGLEIVHEFTNTNINNLNPILVGDFNGDGKTDFLVATANNTNFIRFLSTGISFVQSSTSLPFKESSQVNSNVYLNYYITTDFNSDGKTDVIVINNNAVRSSPFNTNYNYSLKINCHENYGNFSTNTTNTYFAEIQNNNVLNDGSNQGLGLYVVPIFDSPSRPQSNSNFSIISNRKVFNFINKKDFSKDKLLKSITLGNGLKEEIEYRSLQDEPCENYPMECNKVYTTSFDSYQYPKVRVKSSLNFKVVKYVTQISSPTQSRKKLYRYRDLIVSLDGSGNSGFKKMLESNWYNTQSEFIASVSEYDIEKRGVLKKSFAKVGWNFDLGSSNIGINETISYSENSNINFEVLPNKSFKTQIANSINHNPLTNSSIESIQENFDIYNNPQTVRSIVRENGSILQETVKQIQFNNLLSTGLSVKQTIGQIKQVDETVNITDNPLTTDLNETNTTSSQKKFEYFQNNIVSSIKSKGHNTHEITESNLCNAFGNITKKTLSAPNMVNRVTEFGFTSDERFLKSSKDVESLTTQYEYDNNADTFGFLTKVTNPYGQTNTFTYDKWGKILTETDYLGKIKTTSYHVPVNLPYHVVTTNHDDGSSMSSTFDLLGREMFSIEKNIDNTFTRVNKTYDIYNRLISTSEPFLEGQNSPSNYSTVLFDVLGRPTTVTELTGKTTTYNYNGLETIMTVSDGSKEVKTTANALGQIIRVEDTPGGIIDYSYYANGQLRRTSFEGNKVELTYDGWGNKTSLNDPSAGFYSYSYNEFNELTNESTPNGSTDYDIDDFGKNTKKVVSGLNTDMVTDYIFNPTTKLLDQMIVVDNTQSQEYYKTTTYNYVYDDFKRLSSVQELAPYAHFQRSFQFDDFGRTTREFYHAVDIFSSKSMSKWVKHEYKNGYHWKIIDDQTQNVLYQVNSVNARGQITDSQFRVDGDNKITMLDAYDEFGYPSYQLHDKTGTNAFLLMQNTTNFHPQRGNLMSRFYEINHNSTQVIPQAEIFQYDTLDRLTHINNVQNHFYDNKGRITLNSDIGAYNYNPAKNYQLADVTLNSDGIDHYNAIQNQGATIQQVAYNAFKSPLSIFKPATDKILFIYNTFGQRSSVFNGNPTNNDPNLMPNRKHYSFDGTMEIKKHKRLTVLDRGRRVPVEFYNLSLDQTAEYNDVHDFVFYIGGDAYSAPIVFTKSESEIISLSNQEQYLFLHRDYQGSILAVSNYSGEVLEKRQYDAWGALKYYWNNRSQDLTLIPNGLYGYPSILFDRGYTGHEHLFSVDLIHMNGRLYDPVTHRFLSPDNFVQDPYNTQSYNRYGYVFNNPLRYIDPTGETAEGGGGEFDSGGWIGNALATFNNIDWKQVREDIRPLQRFINRNWDSMVNDVRNWTFAKDVARAAQDTWNFLTGKKETYYKTISLPTFSNFNVSSDWMGEGFSSVLTFSSNFVAGTHLGHQNFINNIYTGVTEGVPMLIMTSHLANLHIQNGNFSSGFGIHANNAMNIAKGIVSPITQTYSGVNHLIDGNAYLAGADFAEAGDGLTLSLVTYGAGRGVGGFSGLSKGLLQPKWLRGSGGQINGFTISKGAGYGAKPRFDFHKLSNTFNSRPNSRMTIPKWLDGKKLPHWHRGKGNNLKYHRPWEIGPDGKRRW